MGDSSVPDQSRTYKKAMIVDDDDVDRFITERIIFEAKLAEKVITRTNVDDAIDYINVAIENFRENLPDIIFLNMKLSGRSGCDFITEYSMMNEYVKSNCRIVLLVNSIKRELNNDDMEKLKSLNILVYEKPIYVETARQIKLV
jgi:two-component SAPR family response regulator